jgi:hypothetical protein
MKKLYLAITALLCAASFAGGWFSRRPASEIKIVRQTETVREWKYRDIDRLPLTEQMMRFRECYYSPIEIEGIMRQNTLHVRAGNECQTAQRDFALECGQSGGWRTYAIIGGAGILAGGAAVLLLR